MDPVRGLEQLAYSLASAGVQKRSALHMFKRFCCEQLTPEEQSHPDLVHTYRMRFLFAYDSLFG